MKKRKFFTEERFANIIRWWAAAAVYFFVGWGTSLGSQTNIIDFVFFLGLAIGIAEMFIVAPIIRNMFNTSEGFYWRQKTVWQQAGTRLIIVFRSIFLMTLIVVTYDAINMAAIRIGGLHPDTVLLPGEPVLFGIFYLMYFTLITSMTRRFKVMSKERE